MAGYLVAEEILELVQVISEALGEPVTEFARDRGVVGTRRPGRQEPVQAGALITLVLPVLVFFLAQRVFMQGIVFTGVEK